jgi:hypothetical protein
MHMFTPDSFPQIARGIIKFFDFLVKFGAHLGKVCQPAFLLILTELRWLGVELKF